jgi:hypothetical protein
MARPTKLTPKVRDAILASIEAGAYAEQAARAAGIAPSTYYSWVERGEAREAPFSEFVDALRAREATAEVVAVTALRDAAAAGDWRAAPVTRAELAWAEVSEMNDETLDAELASLMEASGWRPPATEASRA